MCFTAKIMFFSDYSRKYNRGRKFSLYRLVSLFSLYPVHESAATSRDKKKNTNSAILSIQWLCCAIRGGGTIRIQILLYSGRQYWGQSANCNYIRNYIRDCIRNYIRVYIDTYIYLHMYGHRYTIYVYVTSEYDNVRWNLFGCFLGFQYFLNEYVIMRLMYKRKFISSASYLYSKLLRRWPLKCLKCKRRLFLLFVQQLCLTTRYKKKKKTTIKISISDTGASSRYALYVLTGYDFFLFY